MAAVHGMMEGLHERGAIDRQTMREFDAACLALALRLLMSVQNKGLRAIA